MKETITIKGVDVQLLDKQRQILGEALVNQGACQRSQGQLFGYELEALEGIINMLDAWSDNRYNATKNREEVYQNLFKNSE
ncbi:MAG: hypothetical protein DRP42_07275 [Tenericutes bacterium]|nr:MAG: hypothetical protein DRP42_07275 [Mycoplasmatota bacterium]